MAQSIEGSCDEAEQPGGSSDAGQEAANVPNSSPSHRRSSQALLEPPQPQGKHMTAPANLDTNMACSCAHMCRHLDMLSLSCSPPVLRAVCELSSVVREIVPTTPLSLCPCPLGMLIYGDADDNMWMIS